MLNHEYEHEERWLARTKRECNFGLTALIATGITAAVASAGVGAATAATIGAVAAPAVLGAGMGALTAGVTGGDAGKGALYGGLGGLALGGAGAMFPETMGALGLGPQMAGIDAMGNIIPGPGGMGYGALQSSQGGGGGALSALGADPLALGVDSDFTGIGTSPKKGGFLGEIGNALGMSGGGGKSGLAMDEGQGGGGFNWPRALLGLAGGALSAGGGEKLPEVNRGPYYDAPLATGYVTRSPVSPYMPASNDWYSYGQTGNQPQFFNNNQLNFTPRMARGGALSAASRRPAPRPMPSVFDSARGDRFVTGPGDGQSDSVDAKLSAGEYVIDAASVARLGNGSNDAGAKKLDDWRRRLASDTTGNRRVIPRKAREPESYLAAGGRR